MKDWPHRLKIEDERYYDVAHTESTVTALRVFAHVSFFTNKKTILHKKIEKTWPQRAIR